MGVVAEENVFLLVCLVLVSSVEGVCLVQSFPDSQVPPCAPYRSQNAGLDGEVASPGCHRVQSHKQKRKSQQRISVNSGFLNFSLYAQRFGINEELFS